MLHKALTQFVNDVRWGDLDVPGGPQGPVQVDGAPPDEVLTDEQSAGADGEHRHGGCAVEMARHGVGDVGPGLLGVAAQCAVVAASSATSRTAAPSQTTRANPRRPTTWVGNVTAMMCVPIHEPVGSRCVCVGGPVQGRGSRRLTGRVAGRSRVRVVVTPGLRG